MKCPHCSNNIHFFSKALNTFSNPKVCPHCDKKIALVPNNKLILLSVIPIFIAELFVINPLLNTLGFTGKVMPWISSILIVSVATLTLQLKSANDTLPTPKQK